MVKITIERRVTQSDVIDVDFPLFRRTSDVFDSGRSYACIYRMDSDGKVLSITKREDTDGELEFEFKRDAWDVGESVEYLEAKAGSYENATADDWAKVMAEACAFIGTF